MKKFKILGKTILEWGPEDTPIIPAESYKKDPVVAPPSGRVSSQPLDVASTGLISADLESGLRLIAPEKEIELSPVIRKLVRYNPDLSQALENVVTLCNTGHTVHFDDSVKTDDINKMRQALEDNKGNWSESQPDMNGVINKIIRQVITGGAVSGEWVPNDDLSGIKTVVLVNPEEVRWVYDKKAVKYLPYQMVNAMDQEAFKSLIPLNPLTYKYYALNGDTELPYGYSPYIPSLDAVAIQKSMVTNIKFIIETIGLMGFMEVLMDKPDKYGTESDGAYIERLNKLLEEVKKNVGASLKEGISVGFNGDTEYKFNATSRNIGDMSSLWELNEVNVMSGINQDPALLGRAYSTTETQINVVFSKLLAQLKNLQNILAAFLEFGYSLHLRLQGYNFKKLNVKFNEPTAIDKLKEEQASEIKIRNLNSLYNAGIISQDQFAHASGYAEPSEKEPRFVANGQITPAEAKQAREDKKNKSDVKVREKNKPGSAVKRK